ncbi:hypothetical protein V1284_000712 [Nitrobacteraceae bacterium AZCC 2299]
MWHRSHYSRGLTISGAVAPDRYRQMMTIDATTAV